MRTSYLLTGLAALGLSTSGCALLAAAGLGVMAHDEATEHDDDFDPLENASAEVEEAAEDVAEDIDDDFNDLDNDGIDDDLEDDD